MALAGGAVFLLAYLAVSPVAGALQDGPAPLPTAPVGETVAYLAANPGATIATSVLQAVSVLGFGVFLIAVLPALRSLDPAAARRLGSVGWLSVAAMLASCVIGVTALAMVDSVPAETVGALRMANFYTGGVANVATLGLFVFGASRVLGRALAVGRPTVWLGYVAGVLGMLSVASLALYYANAFLPVGRVLSMAWTVVAAASLLRAARAQRREPAA